MADFEIPRDDKGEVLPHDHPNFGPGQTLIRRIADTSHWIVDDQNRNCRRLSSAVYKYNDPTNHLSCDSPVCIEALGHQPTAWVTSDFWVGSLTLPVDKLREIQGATETHVGMVPLEDNACHGGVWAKITSGRSNDMLRASEWLVPIEGVAISDQHDPHVAQG